MQLEISNQWFPVKPYTVGICPGNLVFLCILLTPSPTEPRNRAEQSKNKEKKEKRKNNKEKEKREIKKRKKKVRKKTQFLKTRSLHFIQSWVYWQHFIFVSSFKF